jgi:hypothetical protein
MLQSLARQPAGTYVFLSWSHRPKLHGRLVRVSGVAVHLDCATVSAADVRRAFVAWSAGPLPEFITGPQA